MMKNNALYGHSQISERDNPQDDVVEALTSKSLQLKEIMKCNDRMYLRIT